MEHPGGLSKWKYQVKSGFLSGINYVTILAPANSEESITQLFDAALQSKPKCHYKIVSVSHVHTTTGMIMPIWSIALLAHQHGALLVVNGAQSTGSVIGLNLATSGADMYSISGHKGLLGPTGSGGLNEMAKHGQQLAFHTQK
eukprot:9702346-Ditylum_brightwellii.AAC.1